jgi:hypothetical protein
MVLSLFENIKPSANNYPTLGNSENTNSYFSKFYFYIFPYIKLTTLILILIISFAIIKIYFNPFKGVLNKDKDNHMHESSEKITITNPNSWEKKHNDTSYSSGVLLKGRTRRTPKPINYKELFQHASLSDYEGGINKKDVSENVSLLNQSVCQSQVSVDYIFDCAGNKMNDMYSSNEYVSNELPHANVDLLILDDLKMNMNMNMNKSLPIIKEENDLEIEQEEFSEADKHSRLINRLVNQRNAHATAITNFKK